MDFASDLLVADPQSERRADARFWSVGWALALATVLAALLIGLGAVPLTLAAGLAAAALPGVAGALFVGGSSRLDWALPLWSLAVAVAAVLAGGMFGPLGPLLFGPLAAALVFGFTPAKGLWATLAAFVLSSLAQWLALTAPAPANPAAMLTAGAAMLVAAVALTAAATLRSRRLGARLAAASEDQNFFLELADALPVTTLALDRYGAVEAKLGPLASGLQRAMDGGLLAAAAEADRPALAAAFERAASQGFAETSFSPLLAPDRRLSVSLRPRGKTGLAGMVRDITDQSLQERAAEPVFEPASPSAPVLVADVGATDGRVAELEAALVRSEAARVDAEHSAQARSRFLANMSHELRTPLNAILGFSDIMKTRLFGPIPDRYGEYAELIHDSGRHLTDLINDVLDMSKIEADRYELRVERFDVRDAVAAALRLVRLQADEVGVQLRGSSPREPLWVEADRRAIKQMVLNLVTNALKFTPKGGEVTVTTEATPDRLLDIIVADTGVGIAAEDLERLGRPFEQAGDAESRSRGTGLGLSLVKALAELHGGELRLESALGEGTSATIRLPVIEPLAEQPAPPEAAAEPEAPVALEAPPPPEPPPTPTPRAAEVIAFSSLRPPQTPPA